MSDYSQHLSDDHDDDAYLRYLENRPRSVAAVDDPDCLVCGGAGTVTDTQGTFLPCPAGGHRSPR